MRRPLGVLVVAAALLVPGSAGAQATQLFASVGPGFEIALLDAYGSRVTLLAPGTYDVVVDDQSDMHNFHLRGPGVDRRTDVQFVGKTTLTVTLAAGSYTFVCDMHPTQMRGSFVVGSQPPPPPPTARRKLNASVGPGFAIALRTPAGSRVVTAKAGLYDITVRDRSARHSFHLVGAGVNRKTTVAFRGTVTWRGVRLQAGRTYRFFCDAHRLRMRGSFRTTR